MRIEKVRQEQLRRRRGLARRTFLQAIWLLFCLAIAYFVAQWLLAEQYLTYEFFYRQLFVPRSVPEEVILGAIILTIVILFQFFILIGYLFGSSEGRARTGVASAESKNPDPLDSYQKR